MSAADLQGLIWLVVKIALGLLAWLLTLGWAYRRGRQEGRAGRRRGELLGAVAGAVEPPYHLLDLFEQDRISWPDRIRRLVRGSASEGQILRIEVRRVGHRDDLEPQREGGEQ